MLSYRLQFVFGSNRFETVVTSLDDLAALVYRLRYHYDNFRSISDQLDAGVFPYYFAREPFGPARPILLDVHADVLNTGREKALNVGDLYRRGRTLMTAKTWFYRGGRRFWNGEGPVPGTGRIGSYSYFRRPETMAERRQNCAVDPAEPAARARRQNLPSSWDDICRTWMRNWKAQHKGRKAWDR